MSPVDESVYDENVYKAEDLLPVGELNGEKIVVIPDDKYHKGDEPGSIIVFGQSEPRRSSTGRSVSYRMLDAKQLESPPKKVMLNDGSVYKLVHTLTEGRSMTFSAIYTLLPSS